MISKVLQDFYFCFFFLNQLESSHYQRITIYCERLIWIRKKTFNNTWIIKILHKYLQNKSVRHCPFELWIFCYIGGKKQLKYISEVKKMYIDSYIILTFKTMIWYYSIWHLFCIQRYPWTSFPPTDWTLLKNHPIMKNNN